MVQIVEVTTRAQLRKFVDYPNQLYRDVPQFVPATYSDDLEDWNRKKIRPMHTVKRAAGLPCATVVLSAESVRF